MVNQYQYQDNSFQVTAAIALGASTSAAIVTNGCRFTALVAPQMTATTAYLNVQGSLDGSTYAQLYDEAGNARRIAVSASAARYVELDSWLGRYPYMKLDAVASDGTTQVNQDAAKTLTAVLVSE